MITDPVSVIVPTYNRAHLLRRALDSAIPQLEAGDEIIVVDDGSRDGTSELVKDYGSRIKYVQSDHRGAGAARNLGIDEAIHPLLAFLDSDDCWMAGKLALQRQVLSLHKEILFCFSNFGIIGEDGRECRFALNTWSHDLRDWEEILGPAIPISRLGVQTSDGLDVNTHRGSIYLAEMSANYINVNTLLVRRSSKTREARFAEDLPTYEDWEYFGQISRGGECIYLDMETAWQYGHAGPRLTDANRLVCAQVRIKSLERLWGGDLEFVKQYDDVYRRVLEEQRHIVLRGLIARGEMESAREVMRSMSAVPLSLRLLVLLPGVLIRGLLQIRRFLLRR